MSLYPYQQAGVAYLASRPRAYLADEMGLGKTVQVCAACQLLDLKRVLLIAPASTLPNWKYEFESWGPRGATLAAASYDKVVRNPRDYNGADFDVVILDEAHYAKSASAKRTKAALAIAEAAPRAWLLSGTPMPNHPGELYAPLKALWPDLLPGNYWQFFNRYTKWRKSQYGPKPFGVKDKAGLRALLSKVMLRRTVQSVALDLPPLRVDVQLLPRDNELLELLGDDAATLAALVAEEKAEQSSSSRLRRLLGIYKAPAIASIIAGELEDGEYRKIVVLAHHTDVLNDTHNRLEEFGVVRIDGTTGQAKRAAAIEAFTNDPDVRVFLGQQTAAGTGLNLQVAHEIVLMEPSWVPAENAQAIKRIHRIGSDAPCRARIFAVADSLDESVMRTLATKSRILDDAGLA